MKKLIKNLDPEIVWVTILLFLGVVVYYFEP